MGAILLTVAISAVTLIRHWSFLSTDFDMAFYTHVVAQLSRGEWINTMFGFHVFADHFSPILVLLAPVGWWAPAEGLLVVQALAVGSGVIAAYRLGHSVVSERVGRLAALWFGLSASIWHTVMYDFRPATLGVVAMLWLVAELEGRERSVVVVALAALAAASREDVAVLAALILVIHGALRHRKRTLLIGIATGGVGLWYTLAGQKLFAPFAYTQGYRYADYGHTPGEILANLDYAFPTAAERVIRDDPLIALAALLVPVLVLPPILGWRRSWPAGLIFLSNAISADPFVPSIHYQYYIAAVVFIIWGSVHAYRSPRLRERSGLTALASIAIFVVVGPMGLVLPSPEGRSWASVVSHLDRASIADALEVVPDGVSVSASRYILPHLASNPEIKPFPAPMVCSPVLLTYHSSTSYPDFVVLETPMADEEEAHLRSLGYEPTRQAPKVTVWRSSGDHPEPITCPSVEQARLGLFERVERNANQ